MTKINIGIIGGGLSGLTTAYEIQKQLKEDVNVTVFEKEVNLGGRIHSKEFQNCPIELGAQFFIDEGEVHNLIKVFNLESEVIPLTNNFISFYFDNEIFLRDEITDIDLFKSDLVLQEKKQLFGQLKNKIIFTQELIAPSFEDWYKKNIGTFLLPFWNRMLMSIGVRDIRSINAYFGLILLKVFFGKNYLLKTGLNQLIENLSKNIISSGGEIITNAKCKKLQNINETFYVDYQKNNETKEGKIFDKIISTVTPEELVKFYHIDILKPLNEIDSYPMTLYVIDLKDKLWDLTWGLIICDEKSPIYALCDWRNISPVSKNTPILAICSPFVTSEEIITELNRLFPSKKNKYTLIYEKKWIVGLHQSDEKFFRISRQLIDKLPNNFYLAGDWMVLPALEGAVVSGKKAVNALIKHL